MLEKCVLPSWQAYNGFDRQTQRKGSWRSVGGCSCSLGSITCNTVRARSRKSPNTGLFSVSFLKMVSLPLSDYIQNHALFYYWLPFFGHLLYRWYVIELQKWRQDLTRRSVCRTHWTNQHWTELIMFSSKHTSFHVIALLPYNSQTIWFISLKYTIQWLLLYSQNCATIPNISLQSICITPKRNSIFISSHFSFPPPQPLATTSWFSVSQLTYFGYFI